MAYENVYAPLGNLTNVSPRPGGICTITLFKWEDVSVWPTIDPTTGVLQDAVQLLPGKSFYTVTASEKDRSYDEEDKEGGAGPYVEMRLNCQLMGNDAALLLSLMAAQNQQFGIIYKDRDGMQRLIGNEDSGARILRKYSTGDVESSRKWQVGFSWSSQTNAPVYTTDAFTITIGGTAFVVGTLTHVQIFQVNAPGSPMTDVDTTYTNPLLAGKKVLCLVDGTSLPVDDGSGAVDWTSLLNRHIEKTDASTTITFVGGVVDKEIIDIYAY
jgi:hypothetical protein